MISQFLDRKVTILFPVHFGSMLHLKSLLLTYRRMSRPICRLRDWSSFQDYDPSRSPSSCGMHLQNSFFNRCICTWGYNAHVGWPYLRASEARSHRVAMGTFLLFLFYSSLFLLLFLFTDFLRFAEKSISTASTFFCNHGDVLATTMERNPCRLM